MKKYILLMQVAVMALTVSCSEEINLNVESEGQQIELSAYIESSSMTKVSFGEVTAENTTPVLWSAADEIKVYSENGDMAIFALTGGEGTVAAKFSGKIKNAPEWAAFPASMFGDTPTAVTFPVNQKYVAGGIEPSAFPMVAEIDGSEIHFRNLCGVLKLQLSASEDITVKSITLWCGDKVANSDPMSGRAAVTYGDRPSLAFESRSPRYVKLDCSAESDGGVFLSSEKKDFYIVTPPSYVNFFSIEVETTDNRIVHKMTDADDRNILKRGEMKIMPEIVLDGFEDKYARGTFVLNEGNMTNETGTLTYISPFGTVTDSAYYKANGLLLGNVAQDMFIGGGKMFIICQNGSKYGGLGTLVIADARTLKKEQIVEASALPGISWPSHVAAADGLVYIRDNKGVYSFDPSSGEYLFVEGTSGAAKNRMTVSYGKVFVPAGNKIFVLEKGSLVHTITGLPGTVSGVVKAWDGNLFVSCTSSPAQILKVSSADYSILAANTLGNAKVSAGWGASPAISAKGNLIYFSNAQTVIYRHDFSTGETVRMTDVKEYVEFPGIVYNNPGVHPETGYLFFNTIKGYGMGYQTNDISVFDFSAGETVFRYDFQEHTSFPAGVFFPQYFE